MIFAIVAVLLSIAGAFYQDPLLWTSPVWRWGGAILNSIGVLGAVLGIRTMVSIKSE